MLTVTNISAGYSSEDIIRDISFNVNKGELFGIIGPNGCGKTTLLKVISNVIKPRQGEITIDGKRLTDYTTKQFAKKVAVLPQQTSDSFSYTVKETVSLGRYAHQTGLFQAMTEEDEAIISEVMEQTGVLRYENYYLNELSGGERQRVFLAQALAQQPEILLLDEPTNHLDLSYQKSLLDLLKKWTTEQGLTVISIFHDLNLASLYCDRLLLLENGVVNVVDDANEVLKEDRLKSVYKTKLNKHPHPKLARPQMTLMPKESCQKDEFTNIDEGYLTVGAEFISLSVPIFLRTMSSSVVGAGTGWYKTFVNRHVHKDYDCTDHHNEMEQFLQKNNFDLSSTVGMMTAVNLNDVAYEKVTSDNISVFVVVTAGLSNAVDVTRRNNCELTYLPGTINTWIFVNGHLSEEAFIQSIVTATETKVKVMYEQNVIDEETGTIATGTSTDSILVASTQRGEKIQYAGSITPLGRLISKALYKCLTEAVLKNKRRHQL